MSASKVGRQFTVSYRLGAPYDERLRVAAEAIGATPHQLARLILVQHFEMTEAFEVKEGLELVLAELRSFRQAFDDALE